MQYGVRPEGMDDAQWLVECQCRTVARAMKAGRDKVARGQIFDQWQKSLPGISKQRVAQIWRDGVPMPSNEQARG